MFLPIASFAEDDWSGYSTVDNAWDGQKTITNKQFEETMAALKSCYHDDPEGFHRHADELMCTILKAYGFGAGINIFEKAKKWYA